jgi:predicted NBD/HSP70 family sugar kinase
VRKIDLTNFQVATSETARQINRRITLNFLRHHQPMSRADLSRRSGLQRSTVSAIVDQLIEEGWVTEGAIGRLPRGRRPRFLHLNVERTGIVGVNLRPETTTVGLANVDARVEAQRTFPTPEDPPAFVRMVARTIASLRAAHPRMVCEGVGVSLPGRVDDSGRLVFAPNLGWRDVNLRQMLESATGLSVNVENAANACALGELWFGRHDEHVRHLVAVTVSEGIGVGVLLNGQLVHGANAMAGEFGHMTLDEDGPPCCCGKRGCWERFASNSAAVEHYTAGASTAHRQPATPVRFEDILHLAGTGEPHAVETLERMAHFLGVGLATIVTGLAPQVLVVIGEVTSAWNRVGPIVHDVLARRALRETPTQVIPTDHTTQPRLRGAVTLVVQQHFGVPNVA